MTSCGYFVGRHKKKRISLRMNEARPNGRRCEEVVAGDDGARLNGKCVGLITPVRVLL